MLSALTTALLLSGCVTTSAAGEESEELICSDAAPGQHHRVGDTPIIDGYIIAGGGELGFRPCNSGDTYFIRASVAIWDALEAGLHASPGGDTAYVRFRGVELECTSDIPEPYVGGVRIEAILAAGSVSPANCE